MRWKRRKIEGFGRGYSLYCTAATLIRSVEASFLVVIDGMHPIRGVRHDAIAIGNGAFPAHRQRLTASADPTEIKVLFHRGKASTFPPLLCHLANSRRQKRSAPLQLQKLSGRLIVVRYHQHFGTKNGQQSPGGRHLTLRLHPFSQLPVPSHEGNSLSRPAVQQP